MNRRNFFKSAAKLSVLAGAAVVLPKVAEARYEYAEIELWHRVTYDVPPSLTEDREVVYRLGVGYYRNPLVDGKVQCHICSKPMHDHGWIDIYEDGIIVCPGDLLMKHTDEVFYPLERLPT
jgi:hypothetical protein